MRRTPFILALILMAAGAAWADPPPAIPLTVTDGTHTVTATKKVTVSGGTVGGSAGLATITFSGGGGASLTVSDGTNTVAGTSSLTFVGGVVSGSSGAATVTIDGTDPFGVSTLDPIDAGQFVALSNGNLTATFNSGYYGLVRSTLPRSQGDLYFEATITALGVNGPCLSIGIGAGYAGLSTGSGGIVGIGGDSFSVALNDINQSINSLGFGRFGLYPNLAVGTVVREAISFTHDDVWIQTCSSSGTCTLWNNDSSANPTTYVNGARSNGFSTNVSGIFKGGHVYVAAAGDWNAAVTFNFGAAAFVYGPPSGYRAWN